MKRWRNLNFLKRDLLNAQRFYSIIAKKGKKLDTVYVRPSHHINIC